MADPTISHGWVTSQPDAGKDVDADNLNDHQITGFSVAVSAIVTPAIATEAALARNADNLTSGTVADARIASTIARDSEVTSAVAALSTVYQPLDSDLTAIAALTTTAFGRSVLALTDAAALRTLGGSVIGTDVEAHDADLTTIAGLAPSNDDVLQRKAGAWTNRTIAQLLTDLGIAAAYQPLDSDLTAIAALTTTSYGRAFLALADAAAGRTALGLGTLATQSGTFSGTSSGTNTGDQSLPTRVSLGLDTTDSPQFAGVNVGAATDTTITRTGAGDIAVEGNGLYRAGGTDVAVADGGTGSSTASAARTALGLAIGTDVAAQSVDAAQGTGSLRTITTSAAQAIGTAAAGAGTAAASSNHVHPTGAGTPSTQAFGDAASTGTGPAAAMSDHKHAMPANPSASTKLDYVELTAAGTNVTATADASANTLITGSAVVYDGSTEIEIEAFFPDAETGGGFLGFLLYEGSTDLGRMGQHLGTREPITVKRRYTPAAGTRTHSIRAIVSSGTGQLRCGSGGAASLFPGFMSITRV